MVDTFIVGFNVQDFDMSIIHVILLQIFYKIDILIVDFTSVSFGINCVRL